MLGKCVLLLILLAVSGCSHIDTTEGEVVMPEGVKTLTVDNVELAYRDCGEGPPIVFIHGFGASSYSWQEVAKQLSSSHRTICLDLMGFGRSGKPLKETYTLQRQATLVRGFITQLQLKEPILVGHSYGGGVCLSIVDQLRCENELDVKALVLVDTICYPQKFPDFIKVLRSSFLRTLVFKLVSTRKSVMSLLELVYYRHDRIKPETVTEYASALKMKGGREALAATAASILPKDMPSFTDAYSHISIPSLVIWGEHDEIIPKGLGQRLSCQLPRAEFVVIQDSGHAPQEEVPENTIQAIEGFITKLSSSAE